MPARLAESKPKTLKKRAAGKVVAGRYSWFGARAVPAKLDAFGVRVSGGGTHQSKTMMLGELESLLAIRQYTPEALRHAVTIENVLGKSTANTRTLTYRHLSALYGLAQQPPLTHVFLRLWKMCPAARPHLALLVALARDPLLRDTAQVVIEGDVGAPLQRPLFEALLAKKHPRRFSDSMLRSLAQNCASTFTQSGHLVGAVRKRRQRIAVVPEVVALATLLASVSGFGGPAMLDTPWIRILDLAPEQALDQLRRAEGLGLARVRSAGDVTEISTHKQFAVTLRIPEIELAR